jgi:5-methylcytosine-specific restriction endonuclease McrA
VSKHSIKGKRWDDVCERVKARDGRQCVRCGEVEDLTVDHIKPVSLFDEDDWAADRAYDMAELVTLCRPCNSEKGNRAEPIRINYFNSRFFDG